MGEVDSWEEAKFNEVFEDEIRLLNRRFLHDTSCYVEKGDFIKEIEGILQSLYLMADFNSEGKVQEITLRATITAYEAFIYEKKKGKDE
jgi:hypothetical protein